MHRLWRKRVEEGRGENPSKTHLKSRERGQRGVEKKRKMEERRGGAISSSRQDSSHV